MSWETFHLILILFIFQHPHPGKHLLNGQRPLEAFCHIPLFKSGRNYIFMCEEALSEKVSSARFNYPFRAFSGIYVKG